MKVRYTCPLCPNGVETTFRLPEPPRCINYEAHHSRRYVAMTEVLSVEQQLQELL